LTDGAAAAGIDFRHHNGMTGERFMWEILGSGAALFDYDGDGDLDLFLVQGAARDGEGRPLTDRLYRNDTAAGQGPRFTDVTAAAGIAPLPAAPGYQGMGVAVGDVDGDGDLDLYVTAHGPNRLLMNRGDGTFEDRTTAAGAGDDRWSTAAVLFDADGDGDLDLFLTNYVAAEVGNHQRCFAKTGEPDYCGPLAYPAQADRLLANRGDGTFDDATLASGLTAAPAAPGLGALAADLTGDGVTDLYVANDQAPNHLWIGRGGGRFEEGALAAGCAVSGEGRAEASMGVTAADLDEDRDLDLFLTHLAGETDTLYAHQGDGLFLDITPKSGLGAPSLLWTSFGTLAVDLDLDGHLDLPVVSGAIHEDPAQRRAGDPLPLAQPSRVFRGVGGGRFADATAGIAPELAAPAVYRALAAGDLDNDGDPDLVVTRVGERPLLLVNRTTAGARWVGIEPVSRGGPGAGALVELEGAGHSVRLRRAASDSSYLTASDPRVVFPFDDTTATVVVHWPGGRRERFPGLAPGRYHTLRQGSGAPVSNPTGSPPAAPSPSIARISSPVTAPPVTTGTPPAAAAPFELPAPPVVADPAVGRQLRDRERWLGRLLARPDLPVADQARALGELGTLYHAYQLWDAAHALYREAHRRAPAEPRWLYYLGQLHRARGDLEDSAAAFAAAIERDPRDVASRVRQGEVLLELGRGPEAEAALTAALDRDPRSAAALFHLGRHELETGRPAAAVAHLERALALQPAATAIHQPLGAALRQLGRTADGARHQDRAGAVTVTLADPLSAQLDALAEGQRRFINEGIEALRRSHPEEAAQSFARAVEADPLSSRPRSYLATTLTLLGQQEAAEHHIAIAVDLAPGEPEVQEHAAFVAARGRNRAGGEAPRH
jgi:tetratricopeptide (TPR) repeat protein